MTGHERQHRITKLETQKFEDAVEAVSQTKPGAAVQPRLHRAMIESLESELAILREDLKRYETRA
jgi:hypothetical protein